MSTFIDGRLPFHVNAISISSSLMFIKMRSRLLAILLSLGVCIGFYEAAGQGKLVIEGVSSFTANGHGGELKVETQAGAVTTFIIAPTNKSSI